ncbi:MAG TPA: alpha/beta fold hydrolase [Ktedonobacteraceae bacterium]
MKTHIHSLALAYTDHGIGLPVIFLHAFPLNRHMWDGEIQALLADQRYRLIALDWRGFGESELSSSSTKPVISTMDMFASDVAGLMDVLGIEQAVLCGLSMGGYAAFAFARSYPQRLRALILADTRPGADTPEAVGNREVVAQLAETQGSGAIADLQLPRLVSDYTRRHHPEVETRIRQLIDAATPHGIAAASRGMAVRLDASDLLPTIACPTLVVVGADDVLTPAPGARDYAAQIPGAQLAIIPHAGHLSNLEQPLNFIQTIRAFLQTLS